MRTSFALTFTCFLVAALDRINTITAVPTYDAPAPIPAPGSYAPQPNTGNVGHHNHPSGYGGDRDHGRDYHGKRPEDCDDNKHKPVYVTKRNYVDYAAPSTPYGGVVTPTYTPSAGKDNVHYKKPVVPKHGGKDNYHSNSSKSHGGKSGHGHSKTKDCDKNKPKPNPAYIVKRGYNDYAPKPAPQPTYGNAPTGNNKVYRNPVSTDKSKSVYQNGSNKSHGSKGYGSKGHGSKSHGGKSYGSKSHGGKSGHGHSKTKDCDKNKPKPNPAYIVKRGYNDYAPKPAPQPTYGNAPTGNNKVYRNPVSTDKSKSVYQNGSNKSHGSKDTEARTRQQEPWCHGSKSHGSMSKPVTTPYVPPRP
ncbi:hypothetical protein BDF22DRAFT_665235 [Syncephalis plumigaleata]|nr:hypothetical protein BDF22DRAFT_665235 [Syncephalis plumigaleata]